jgi:hypothetical protein
VYWTFSSISMHPSAAKPQPKTTRAIRERSCFDASLCNHKAKVKLGPTGSFGPSRMVNSLLALALTLIPSLISETLVPAFVRNGI